MTIPNFYAIIIKDKTMIISPVYLVDSKISCTFTPEFETGRNASISEPRSSDQN